MTEHWTKLRVRKGGHMSARTRVEQSPGLSRLLDERLSTLADPVRGITTDGVAREGLYPLAATAASTKPITEAAQNVSSGIDGRAAGPNDARARCGRVANLEQHSSQLLAPRDDAGGSARRDPEAGAGPRRRNAVRPRIRSGPRHHASERAACRRLREPRRVRRVAVLPFHLRRAIRLRTLGLAARRTPPEHQLHGDRRSPGDDANVHGIGALRRGRRAAGR